MSANQQIQVYGTSYSGNCYKLKLLLTQLQHSFQWHEIDILKGESRTAEFLAMNANGKVPVLQISEDPEGFFGGSVDVFTNFELNSNYQNLGFLLVRNNNVEPVSAPSAALTGLLLLLIASWRRRHR